MRKSAQILQVSHGKSFYKECNRRGAGHSSKPEKRVGFTERLSRRETLLC